MYSVFESLLERDGVTVAEVSRATGINQSTLSNWKKRQGKAGTETYSKLAEYFHVSVEYLMNGRDPSCDDPSAAQPLILDGRVLSAEEIALLRGFRAAIYPIRQTMLFQAREALKGDMEKSSSSASNAETA